MYILLLTSKLLILTLNSLYNYSVIRNICRREQSFRYRLFRVKWLRESWGDENSRYFVLSPNQSTGGLNSEVVSGRIFVRAYTHKCRGVRLSWAWARVLLNGRGSLCHGKQPSPKSFHCFISRVTICGEVGVQGMHVKYDFARS